MKVLRLLALLFLYLNPANGQGSAYSNPVCQSGRTVIVHLFNWKWTDVAAECERFLGPRGFCGVQLSPPNEHRIYNNDHNDGKTRPWWERYQPVSYKLESRSGTRAQFQNMVTRCNNVGVYIYIDAVINHMTGSDAGQGCGTGGTCYDANVPRYDGVYEPGDFNCCNCGRCGTSDCGIQNYNDVNQVRNCRLVGLTDLYLEMDGVRAKVAGYMNDLIGLGVAGFRVDASKHMWPGDVQNIWGRLSNLNSNWFPANTRPFIYQEVIDKGGETIKATEYTHLGRVTEFKYCDAVGQKFRGGALKDMRSVYSDWQMLDGRDAFVFVDNHDNQRGHGGGGSAIITFRESRLYKLATAYTLAHPYGFVRIMSSYSWEPESDDWIGPPYNPDWSIKDVPINPDGTCGDRWVCEHRWRQIYNMVEFRNTVSGSGNPANWWDNGNNQIAFGLGDKGFIAINTENFAMDQWLTTGLPEGTYCDVISGSKNGNSCTGKSITVYTDTRANFAISNSDQDPIIAIHAGSKIN